MKSQMGLTCSSTLSLTSALYEGKWLTPLFSSRFTDWEWTGTHCTGGRVDPRANLVGCGKFAPTGIRSRDRPARSKSLYQGPHVFQKSRSHYRILGSVKVTWSKSHTEDGQIIATTVQNWVTQKTWRPGFFTHLINKHRNGWRIDEYVRTAIIIFLLMKSYYFIQNCQLFGRWNRLIMYPHCGHRMYQRFSFCKVMVKLSLCTPSRHLLDATHRSTHFLKLVTRN